MRTISIVQLRPTPAIVGEHHVHLSGSAKRLRAERAAGRQIAAPARPIYPE